MGQPKKGDRDNVQTIGVDHIRDFYNANYYGDNMVVVATGDVNHDEFVDMVEQQFNTIPKTSDIPTPNTEKPIYTPSILYVRDDEMINSNVGVFYDAPHVHHEDFYSFLLFKNMFGSYRID